MKGRWRDIDKCFLEFSHVFSPLQKHFWPPPLPSKGEDNCVSLIIKLCVPFEFSIRYYMYIVTMETCLYNVLGCALFCEHCTAVKETVDLVDLVDQVFAVLKTRYNNIMVERLLERKDVRCITSFSWFSFSAFISEILYNTCHCITMWMIFFMRVKW